MIKLNFEFDSKDALSSQFYDWLSAFPLNQSNLKITTALDVSDPKTNRSHRIGNIVLDLTPEVVANASLSLKSKNISDQTEDKKSRRRHKADKKVKTEKPARSVFSRFAAKPEPAPSDEKTMELTFDPSILEAVTFEEEILTGQEPVEAVQPAESELFEETVVLEPDISEAETGTEEKTETEAKIEAEGAAETEQETEPVKDDEPEVQTDQEEPKSSENPASHFADNHAAEDFDFLLNSLDEFNG